MPPSSTRVQLRLRVQRHGVVVRPLALLPGLLGGPDEVALLDDGHGAEALLLLLERDHEARVGLDDLPHHVLAQLLLLADYARAQDPE
eukprot:CAMPEP_0179189362 /NCGR_PEP_ID=MMETSP0796-20121207/94003_1 /TAXON_ID=73915 /ORGANISM="Pyrodinium bahamense, Strain pbaha01" /LENGTH=87 /DNA_ID=CAMNT_0020893495 /DNA_START=210 /DNA_END=473 /DNA_ORIENTATION=+